MSDCVCFCFYILVFKINIFKCIYKISVLGFKKKKVVFIRGIKVIILEVEVVYLFCILC